MAKDYAPFSIWQKQAPKAVVDYIHSLPAPDCFFADIMGCSIWLNKTQSVKIGRPNSDAFMGINSRQRAKEIENRLEELFQLSQQEADNGNV